MKWLRFLVAFEVSHAQSSSLFHSSQKAIHKSYRSKDLLHKLSLGITVKVFINNM